MRSVLIYLRMRGRPLLDRCVKRVPVVLAGELGQLGALVGGAEGIADALLAVLALALVRGLPDLGLGDLDLFPLLHVIELDRHSISPLVAGASDIAIGPRRQVW